MILDEANKIPRYLFQNIPNDDDGWHFIKQMKEHLGPRYRFRVRGQHMADGIDWRECQYGLRIDQAKTLRIYLEPRG